MRPGSIRNREWTYLADLPVRLRLRGRAQPKAYWYRGFANLGDQLSPALIEWVSGEQPVWVSRTFRGKILGVGSILHQALSAGDLVWGSGLISPRPIRPPDSATFLGVRGPLTRSLIEADVPDVYGDPAVLLPKFYAPAIDKTHEVGVVPHYFDQADMAVDDPRIRFIDVTRPWNQVVNAILSCDVIASSSLHGLIIAEAYGTPAAWTRGTDSADDSGFKFNDYLLSTKRDESVPVPFDRGLTEVLRRVLPPPSIDPEPLIEAGRTGLPRS